MYHDDMGLCACGQAERASELDGLGARLQLAECCGSLSEQRVLALSRERAYTLIRDFDVPSASERGEGYKAGFIADVRLPSLRSGVSFVSGASANWIVMLCSPR